MVKADMSCDYYGDLEISSSADDAEIKKAYKKLAIKYHPDRNPGREEEITPRFQAIQAAYEVLTDPEQRRKYNVGRHLDGRSAQSQPAYSSRDSYTASSSASASASASRSYGQRGNPWANAGSQWAPPPKPPTAKAPPPSAGAKRYSTFAKDVPVPPRKTADSGAEERRANYSAWEGMRRQAPTAPRPPPPPRPTETTRSNYTVPPRPGFEEFVTQSTEDLKRATNQKKNGYMPSTSGGDEPAATNTGAYYTRSNRPVPPRPDTRPAPPPPPPDFTRPGHPSSQASSDPKPPVPSPDESKRTPYNTRGGERTNPFERFGSDHVQNTNAADPKIYAETTSTDSFYTQPAPTSKSEVKYTSTTQHTSTVRDGEDSSSDESDSIRNRTFAKPRKRTTHKHFIFSPGSYIASDRKPSPQYANLCSPSRVSSIPSITCNFAQSQVNPIHNVYNLPPPQYHPFPIRTFSVDDGRSKGYLSPNFSRKPLSGSYRSYSSSEFSVPTSPSGDQNCSSSVNAFEQIQFDVLHRIISNNERVNSSGVDKTSNKQSMGPSMKNNLHGRGNTVDQAAAISRGPVTGSTLVDQDNFLDESENIGHSMKDRYTSLSDVLSTSSETPFQNLASANTKIASVSSDADGSTSSGLPPFTFANSTEHISTTFAPTNWNGKFQAGDCFMPENSTRGSARSSPQRKTSVSRLSGLTPDLSMDNPHDKDTPHAAPTKFSAEEWAQTFKPQVFAPPYLPSSPAGPSKIRSTRRTRTGSAARIPSRAGAALIDEESPDENKPLFDQTPHESPMEMDVDIPPAQSQTTYRESRASQSSTLEARNVPVEPLRPEWRAGDHSSRHASPVRLDEIVPPLPSKSNEGEANMSNDSKGKADLRTNLDDLKDSEPFKTTACGLNSFKDLSSTLPFPSGAASTPNITPDFTAKRLNLPRPPKAPVLPIIPGNASRPSAASWESYLLAFKAYMAEYGLFNSAILTHFSARKQQVESFKPGWLEAFSDTGLERYVEGVKEDVVVREWWAEAAGRHEVAVSDFMWVKAVYRDGLESHNRKQ